MKACRNAFLRIIVICVFFLFCSAQGLFNHAQKRDTNKHKVEDLRNSKAVGIVCIRYDVTKGISFERSFLNDSALILTCDNTDVFSKEGSDNMVNESQVCSSFWGCLNQFQILIAALFALLGASGVYYAARLQINHQKENQKERELRQAEFARLTLINACKRVSQKIPSIKSSLFYSMGMIYTEYDNFVSIANLQTPSLVNDWEFMIYFTKSDLFADIMALKAEVDDFNIQVANARATFTTEVGKNLLLQSLEKIQNLTDNLVHELEKYKYG